MQKIVTLPLSIADAEVVLRALKLYDKSDVEGLEKARIEWVTKRLLILLIEDEIM